MSGPKELEGKPRKRLESLDSLRFLAATAVLLSHAQAMMPWRPVQWLAATGLTHQKSAVAFFFVLSGLVLHLSLARTRSEFGLREYGSFITRRVFRIYPLYYVSLLIAFAVVTFLPLALCPYFGSDAAGAEVLVRDRGDVKQWIHHVLLISPGLDMQFLNPPIWTLAAEMRVAIVFPLLSILIGRLSLASGAVAVALMFVVAPWAAAKTVPTTALIPLFAIGAWVAQHGMNWSFVKGRAALVIGIVGLAIYAMSPMIRGRDAFSQSMHMNLAGVGSVLVMLMVIYVARARALLEHRWLVLGGQASYGVYALHFPVLMGLAYLAWRGGWPAWAFHVAGLVASVALAITLYRLLELPMIAAGRTVAQRLFGKRPESGRAAQEATSGEIGVAKRASNTDS